MLSDAFVARLVCPKSKQALIYFPRGEDNADEAQGFLLCPASRLRYRIDRGVPVLLVEEAETVADSVVIALVDRAKLLGLRVPA
ncbi:MAG: Trm112 family protein [Kofleriaceae bacterium]